MMKSRGFLLRLTVLLIASGFARADVARLEPEDGRFDFGWLDRGVDLADKNGMQVVMCKPSPCVPAWLVTQHPEVLPQDEKLLPGERALPPAGVLGWKDPG